jgi:hypothetical protein
MSRHCVDQVVGGILSGWRYDISGIAPDMCADYEEHFAACAYCRSKQRLHRIVDVGLIVLATVSAGLFLLAFGAIWHFSPRYALVLQIAALAGFAFSGALWVAVAVATPAPVVMADAARLGARRLHERLPEEIRNRIPEELRPKEQ